MTPTLNADLTKQLGAALERRARARVNAAVKELIARRAPLGKQWNSLAEVMLHNGELTLARAAAARLAHDSNGEPRALFSQAAIVARSGDPVAARAIVERLSPDTVDRASHFYMLASIQTNLGDMASARAHFLEALTANPRSGQCWLGLAMTGNLAGDEALVARILDANVGIKGAPPMERARYFFARGKILDEIGDCDGAFSAWSDGATAMRNERPYQAAQDARSAANAEAGFDRHNIDAIGQNVGVDTSRPILVTGSPRSGTTLVEQILVSHSRVSGGHEFGKFGLIAEDVGGTNASAIQRWLSQGGNATAAAADYVHIIGQRFGTEGRVVDKTLDASRYLGLAASLLPQAGLVWLRRDRLDGALSCIRTYFEHGLSWNVSQQSIAQHFRLEDRLLDRWQSILGDRLLVVDYESLVKNSQSEIRRLLDHCGLAIEPDVFTPHKTERAVTTASLNQVREPINQRAIGGSVRYRKHLQPFVDAYELS